MLLVSLAVLFTHFSLSLAIACVLSLTLEGGHVVAPELGLLGQGSVVGVELHVHLADTGVACSHCDSGIKEKTQFEL